MKFLQFLKKITDSLCISYHAFGSHLSPCPFAPTLILVSPPYETLKKDQKTIKTRKPNQRKNQNSSNNKKNLVVEAVVLPMETQFAL